MKTHPVTTVKAPAKVNLTLHVTGQREDGYHLLDSLVASADIADELTLEPADDNRLMEIDNMAYHKTLMQLKGLWRETSHS